MSSDMLHMTRLMEPMTLMTTPAILMTIRLIVLTFILATIVLLQYCCCCCYTGYCYCNCYCCWCYYYSSSCYRLPRRLPLPLLLIKFNNHNNSCTNSNTHKNIHASKHHNKNNFDIETGMRSTGWPLLIASHQRPHQGGHSPAVHTVDVLEWVLGLGFRLAHSRPARVHRGSLHYIDFATVTDGLGFRAQFQGLCGFGDFRLWCGRFSEL